jgi:hypothetical protein
MDAMFYLQFVRCAHEGTRRIRDSMAELKLPAPEFKQKEVAHALVAGRKSPSTHSQDENVEPLPPRYA